MAMTMNIRSRSSLTNVSNVASILDTRAGEVFPNTRVTPSAKMSRTWGKLCSDEVGDSVLGIIVKFSKTLALAGNTEVNFNAIKYYYPAAPFIYEPSYDPFRGVESITVYGVNGTSITMSESNDYASPTNLLLGTPIIDIPSIPDEYKIFPTSTAVHRIESTESINRIIKLVAKESSMEQLFGLLACGLFDQAKLLASLPMKIDRVTANGIPSFGCFFHEESDPAVILKICNRRPSRNHDRMRQFCGSDLTYDEDVEHLDFARDLANPESAWLIYAIIAEYVPATELYQYFHAKFGSQFVDVIARFEGCSRIDAMKKIAIEAMTLAHPDKEDPTVKEVLKVIDLATSGKFCETTSKHGVFCYADVHAYALTGKNRLGEKDEYLEDCMSALISGMLNPNGSRQIVRDRTLLHDLTDYIICDIPEDVTIHRSGPGTYYGKILSDEIKKGGPAAIAQFVMSTAGVFRAGENSPCYETFMSIINGSE